MTDEGFKFDVAISFLSQDIDIATALCDRLRQSLDVFFSPHSQEELAGTEGLESMRAPFYKQSRVNVVIYRDRWGNTPWTNVEAMAIRDSCLDSFFKGLFVFVVDLGSTRPTWVPDTHMCFSSRDFTLDDAVGAIKTRVLERGGEFKALTPLRRAQLLAAEEDYQYERSKLSTTDGMRLVVLQVRSMFDEIQRLCLEIRAHSLMDIKTSIHFRDGDIANACTITNGRVSVSTVWRKPVGNSISEATLFVREIDGVVGTQMQVQRPREVSATCYLPEISRSKQYGWAEIENKKFVLSTVLAARCVDQFIELVRRNNCGELD